LTKGECEGMPKGEAKNADKKGVNEDEE